MPGPRPRSVAITYELFISNLSSEARTIHLVAIGFMASMGFEKFVLAPVQVEYMPYFAFGTYWRRKHLARVVEELLQTGYWELEEGCYRVVGALASVRNSGLRTPIPPKLRKQVIRRDKGTCQLCFEPVSPDAIHIDHRLPVIAGGLHHADNLQVTHWRCNLRKAAHIQ